MDDYMKPKSVKLLSENPREKVIEGINRVADAVKVTMGPAGRLVLYSGDFGTMGVTKDGVTVARNIKFEDNEMNLGAALIKQSANQTLKGAGDGTTTTCVLSQSFIKNGLAASNSGLNIISLSRELKSVLESKVIPGINSMKREIDDTKIIESTANMSTNHDEELSSVVSEVFNKYGKDIVVTVENSDTGKTEVSITPGISINRGYTRANFAPVNNPITKFENCSILLIDEKLTKPQLLFSKVIQPHFTRVPVTPLIIIAPDFPESFEADMLKNRVAGIPVLPIRAPYYGQKQKDYLSDIAVFTGGKVISDTEGTPLTQADVSVLGVAELVIVDMKSTSIINSRESEGLEDYIESLKEKLSNTSGEYDQLNLKERISKLTAGICSIKVYADTDAELQEKKDRLDDAIRAIKVALEKGLCPGGGSSLFKIALELESEVEDMTKTDLKSVAKIIMSKALKEPTYQLLRNAGLEPVEMMAKVSDEFLCYNLNESTYEDINTTEVLDPIGVLESSLRNALSIAIQVLSIGAVISDVNSEPVVEGQQQ